MTAMDIAREIAEANGVTVEDLRGRARRRKLYPLRRELARRLKTERKMSFTQIGNFMDGRDRSMVMMLVYDHIRERRVAASARAQKAKRARAKAAAVQEGAAKTGIGSFV
jgi:chromosomal replication initiation ATPase DnaA